VTLPSGASFRPFLSSKGDWPRRLDWAGPAALDERVIAGPRRQNERKSLQRDECSAALEGGENALTPADLELRKNGGRTLASVQNLALTPPDRGQTENGEIRPAAMDGGHLLGHGEIRRRPLSLLIVVGLSRVSRGIRGGVGERAFVRCDQAEARAQRGREGGRGACGPGPAARLEKAMIDAGFPHLGPPPFVQKRE